MTICNTFPMSSTFLVCNACFPSIVFYIACVSVCFPCVTRFVCVS